jgi:hypothetical protein
MSGVAFVLFFKYFVYPLAGIALVIVATLVAKKHKLLKNKGLIL